MKKTILYIAQSLDGFVATKDGSVSWLDDYFDVDFGNYSYDKFEKGIDTIVQGSTTYDQFKPKYPGKNSYVFASDADGRNEEGTIFVKGEVKKFVDDLDEKTHENIWLVGGPTLLAGFLNKKLVDEMIIFTMPVLLKEGISLFSNIKVSPNISLQKVKNYEKGVMVSHYNIK